MMSARAISARAILVDALRDFRRTWAQLVLADLMARVLGVAVLTPVVGLLLKVFLMTTATGVVADAAIVTFLLHPTGLAALIVVGAVSLGILFAEMGQLMSIGFGAIEDRRVTWLDALKYAYGRIVDLVRLARLAMTRLLVIALPFLAAIGALYGLFLRAHDINYYLSRKPPVFLVVASLAGLLLTAMALLVITRIAGWLLALPMVLFEGKGAREALQASVQATAAHRWKLAVWLLAWIVGVGLLLATVTFLSGLLGDVLIPRARANLLLLLVGVSAVLLASGVANLAASIFTTALFPLLVTRLYRTLAGPGAMHPEIAARGSLGDKVPWRVPGKRILAAGAVVLILLAAGGYLALRRLDPEDRTEIIAHRGGAAVAPENTKAAFERGIADGADWLELDVQENADGVVVVEHDRDLMRRTGRNLEVWKATSSDLADLDVGSFFGAGFSDQRVPTLREVLELAKGRVGVFIELKYHGHDRDLEAKVVDLVEATGMTSNVAIMSLEYEGVRKTSKLRPDWTYGLLSAVALGDLTRLDVAFLALTADAASYSTIRRAHQRGMKVYAWTVNDPVQMSVMMSRGVDGIITDQVALARHVKELRGALTSLGRFIVWMAGETGLLHGMAASAARDDA
jgi:glycerophosphoryl diester phosphodiesterase